VADVDTDMAFGPLTGVDCAASQAINENRYES